MNCNPCCGCFPPITTYNPSAADNFPTILQQVEYLKALLKKYPSQQWFITQEKVTEETVKLDSMKIPLRGRGIQVGDFILGNTVGGTILIFQYTGALTELTYYVVEYVGVYTNQGLAEQALAKAQDALGIAQTNKQDIDTLQDRVNTLEVVLTPDVATSGTLTQEQYDSLYTDDNGYIVLANIIYKLSKRDNVAGYSVYSSGYLVDSKTVLTITITNSTKSWVKSIASIESETSLYQFEVILSKNDGSLGFSFYFFNKNDIASMETIVTPQWLYMNSDMYFDFYYFEGNDSHGGKNKKFAFCYLDNSTNLVISNGTNEYIVGSMSTNQFSGYAINQREKRRIL